MTPILVPSAAPLREALYALSMAQQVPDADLLDNMIRRYPLHAEALTDFAIDLALDSLLGESAADAMEAAIDPVRVSPVVSRAMSRFQNRLHAVKKTAGAATKLGDPATVEVPNPFANLDRAAFRSFTGRIDANTAFVLKLRDRQIEPETIPEPFKALVASELHAPLDVVVAHFAAARSPTASGRQFYKAEGKPGSERRQSFAEAVASSGLTAEQQQRLLRL
jgi:hypothetical protein